MPTLWDTDPRGGKHQSGSGDPVSGLTTTNLASPGLLGAFYYGGLVLGLGESHVRQQILKTNVTAK